MLTQLSLLNNIIITPQGCWEWQGYRNEDGYGRTYCAAIKKPMYVHRYAYIVFVGPIPHGLELDHFFCQNRACCNPLHVEPVTKRVNLLRRYPRGRVRQTYAQRRLHAYARYAKV